jgi:hypothetical protein
MGDFDLFQMSFTETHTIKKHSKSKLYKSLALKYHTYETNYFFVLHMSL